MGKLARARKKIGLVTVHSAPRSTTQAKVTQAEEANARAIRTFAEELGLPRVTVEPTAWLDTRTNWAEAATIPMITTNVMGDNLVYPAGPLFVDRT